MTAWDRPGLLFSSLGRQQVQADFAGGTRTSDGGGLLLREVDRRIGLFDALTGGLTDPRDPARIRRDPRTLLAQRIYGLALGYEDLNDHTALRTDPLFAVLAEQRPDPAQPLASAPTLCRLEDCAPRASLARMAGVWVDQLRASFDQPPEELILDFDATDDPVHGTQEARFFHGYDDEYSFLPLYVFCGSQLPAAYRPPSHIDAGLHARPILELLVRRLRQVGPHVRIILRGDAGLCRWKLLRWCEQDGVSCMLGLARNPVLERAAAPFRAAAAYVRVETQRRTAWSDTELQAAQAGTIGLKLFKVAARVVTSVRRVVLHRSSAYPLANLLGRVLARLRMRYPLRPAPS